MRLILQTNFKNKIINLDGMDIFRVISISEELVNNNNSKKILFAKYQLTQEQYNNIAHFFKEDGDTLSLGEDIACFKNNNENVKRFREKQKQLKTNNVPVAEKPKDITENSQEKTKEVKTDTVDYDYILKAYHHYFKDSVVKKPKAITEIDKKYIKRIYTKFSKLAGDLPVEQFLNQYYKKLSGQKSIIEGWPWNGTTYKPDFEYLHRADTYNKYMNVQ